MLGETWQDAALAPAVVPWVAGSSAVGHPGELACVLRDFVNKAGPTVPSALRVPCLLSSPFNLQLPGSRAGGSG